MRLSKYRNIQRYSGITGVIILWWGITLAMQRTGLGVIDERPLSYLGVNSLSATLFSTSLLTSACLFLSFGFYVRRRFKVTSRFLTYLGVGQACQIIVAIAPYGMKSSYRTIHTIAAFSLAISLPLLIRAFAHSQSASSHIKIYTGLLRFEQISFVIGIGLFVFTKGIAPLGEALPAIGFHIWIIVITFISVKEKA